MGVARQTLGGAGALSGPAADDLVGFAADLSHPEHEWLRVALRARSAVTRQSGSRWRPTYCDSAIAGKPRMAASRAAAAVPEI